ncbi:anthranilate N-benzoyltransferase protein 1-like [Euphorbia lathyris]|uniref:anthranilate N-benzoyltransferase protein 1-like n=1 Tax=Euphorbia lathyris TaxID=212925 RepID=UPI0033134452
MANVNVVPKSQIEAMQTVPPYKVTHPRQILKVSSEDSIGSSIFKAAVNIILFCDKEADADDDSGWHVAGWIKESLGRALKDEPLLSGRLRRGEDGHGDLEIVSNDSGARLFEATIPITLLDFLALEDVEMAESQLVFWKDIDELIPQFSPLFYVQVTNFQCGGYSIGISCSLLFADVLIIDNFLQKWARIHRDIVSETKKLPTFYLPKLKAPSVNLNSLFPSTTRERLNQTVIYKISSTSEMVDSKENVALVCLEKTEKQLGAGNNKTSSEFALLVKESPKVMRAQNWKKEEIGKSDTENDGVIILKTSYLNDYMRINDVSFREGSKPAMVSYWIGTENGAVQTIAIPSYDKLGDPSHLNVIVTIPYENEIVN